jgi:hypothetical protein
MAVRVSRPKPPKIFVNKRRVSDFWGIQNNPPAGEGWSHEMTFIWGGGITNPAVVTMTAEPGAVIRYTLNGKKVNLGSKKYKAGITLYNDGNGFSSGETILKAKAFLNGESSETTMVMFKLKTPGPSWANGGRSAEKLEGETQPSNWPTTKWGKRNGWRP